MRAEGESRYGIAIGKPHEQMVSTCDICICIRMPSHTHAPAALVIRGPSRTYLLIAVCSRANRNWGRVKVRASTTPCELLLAADEADDEADDETDDETWAAAREPAASIAMKSRSKSAYL